MLFLKIYIGFSILVFILFLMQIYVTSKKFDRQNPEIADKYPQNNKTNTIEDLLIILFHIIKIFITCSIPFINIGLLWVVLFNSTELEERVITKVKTKKRRQ